MSGRRRDASLPPQRAASAPAVEDILTAWNRWSPATRRGAAAAACHRAAVRLLADGAPVAPARIAAATGQPLDGVEAWLEEMREAGYQLDDEGRLVGAALTLRPTAHRFRVRGNDLYAWCGFDTLFLPVLLDEPAQIASSCPVTGTPIRLDLTADGAVIFARPGTAVVAVVGPDIVGTCTTVGPGSAICDQMPLFAEPGAAHQWARGHPGVAILDLDTATGLARATCAQ